MSPAPEPQPPPPVVVALPPSELEQADAGPSEREWVSLEKLEYMVGPWRTQSGEVLASLVSRREAQPRNPNDEFWVAPWRLTVEWVHGPIWVCGLYEGLQEANPPYTLLPWRLGYCVGRSVDPEGPAVVTRVTLLRASGFDGLRFVLGAELDAEIFQVQ